MTDRGYIDGVLRGEAELGPRRPRPLEKERDRRPAGNLLGRDAVRVGGRERRHRVFPLPTQPQRGAAGHDHLDARSCLQEIAHERGCLQQMLEVVQQQEHLARGKDAPHRLERSTSALAQTESRGDGGEDQRGLLERRQIDEDHAVTESVRHARRHLNREAGLPHAGRSDQRQEPLAIREQHVRDLGKLLATADESRQRDGEVRGVACAAGLPGGADPAAGNGQKSGPLASGEPERVRKLGRGLPVRVGPHPTLQIADRPCAHPGALGQRLLGEGTGTAMLPQQITEGGGIRGMVERHAGTAMSRGSIGKEKAPGCGESSDRRQPTQSTVFPRW